MTSMTKRQAEDASAADIELPMAPSPTRTPTRNVMAELPLPLATDERRGTAAWALTTTAGEISRDTPLLPRRSSDDGRL